MKRKKSRKQSSKERYITNLSRDLKKFREREASGETISARERKNMRARELRVMKKMKKEAQPLIDQANLTLDRMNEYGLKTLSMQRVYDEFEGTGKVHFDISQANSYNDIVAEITSASAFLNSPDSTPLAGSRIQKAEELHEKYGDIKKSLTDKTYVQSGLIASEKEASEIFRNYRKIEEYWASLIGKAGQKGVYGSDNLILYMIDVHAQGLDEYEYGIKALENFALERTPEYEELFKQRNEVTGISGLFTNKKVGYGRLAGLI